MDLNIFRSEVYKSLLALATEDGINASGKDETYGCIFGRDTAITVLKLLKIFTNRYASSSLEIDRLADICGRSLITLIGLQGVQFNAESGEEPGKFIHEYRKEKYEHLIRGNRPWFVYPDGKIRNYDSLDSTPLVLIALYNYWKYTEDNNFLIKILPSVERGLNWIINNADLDKDSLVEYSFSDTRKYGGLKVQSWTDSHESLQRKDGSMPQYPIAPVEVQGYAWLAIKQWSRFYSNALNEFSYNPDYAKTLEKWAFRIKRKFNEYFWFKDNGLYFLSQALDGLKNQIQTITGNPLLLLWATYEENGEKETIVDKDRIGDLVDRVFMSDMFEKDAGIRTMSSKSSTYNPGQDSYHNGSFWPKLNGMVHEGLERWGYYKEAELLKTATLRPILFFGTPIELYVKDEKGIYLKYRNRYGQVGCNNQAWSAAVVLDLLTT